MPELFAVGQGVVNVVDHIDDGLYIIDNDSLTSCEGLENLTDLDGLLAIQDNEILTSLSGLNQLDHTALDTVNIRNNPKHILSIRSAGYKFTD